MKFCPKCGSILMPEKDKLACKACRYSEKAEAELKEKIEHKERVGRVAEGEVETMPKENIKCPKCGYGEAFFWLRQTRSSDEPETSFYRCIKCRHTWRKY